MSYKENKAKGAFTTDRSNRNQAENDLGFYLLPYMQAEELHVSESV